MKKTTSLNHIVLILIFMLNLGVSLSQEGIGTSNPNKDAALDISSSNKGLLMPRIELTSTTSFAPLTAHVVGMIVYNTATAGTAPNNVTPGYYYNDGATWVKIASTTDVGATDLTNDAWVNNSGNNRVELGTLSNGTTTRPTEAAFVALDNGNVGIGTGTPSRKLEIEFNSDNSSTTDLRTVEGIFVNNKSTTVNSRTAINLATTGTSAGIAAIGQGPDDSELRLFTEKTQENGGIVLKTGGGVGIGTNTPGFFTSQSHSVTFYEENTSRDLEFVAKDITDNGQPMGRIKFGRVKGNSPATLNAMIGAFTEGSNEEGILTFYTRNTGDNTVKQRMVINNKGDVGIGTTTPQVKLDVAGRTSTTSSSYPPLRSTRTASITTGPLGVTQFRGVTSSDMTDGFGPRFDFAIQDNAGVTNEIAHIGAVRSGADNSGDLIFYTRNAGNEAPKMTIKSSPIGIVTLGNTQEVNATILGSTHNGLQINNRDGSPTLLLKGSRNSVNGAKLWAVRNRVGANLQSNDRILEINASTEDASGSNFSNNASIKFYADGDQIPGASSSGAIRFFTTPENSIKSLFRMTINNNGDVGIGTNNPQTKLHVNGLATTGGFTNYVATSANTKVGSAIGGSWNWFAGNNTQSVAYIQRVGTVGDGTSTNGVDLLRFYNGIALIGAVKHNGTSGVSYAQTSDRRLKEGITETRYTLEDVLKIQAVDYKYKSDSLNNITQTGFIAQDLYKVFPEAVSKGSDELNENGTLKNPWTVDYSKLTPILVKAIQDLKKENEMLKASTKNLEDKLKHQSKNYEARLQQLEKLLNQISLEENINITTEK